ncbi:MAG: UDP-3-O-(3-hydroxymyristoyl)glucosamine N-acyltransferase [Polyangia bacterium]
MAISFSIAELAERIGCEPLGDPRREIGELRALSEAGEGAISPLFRWRLLSEAEELPAAVLGSPELCARALEAGVASAVAGDEPVVALARAIDLFFPEERPDAGISPTASVDDSVEIGAGVWIGPGAVVEAGAVVGEGSWIGPNAVIGRGCRLGRFVRVGPCAVIGHDGFGFVPAEDGPRRVRQVGGVEIGDCAEIGACACVDRATLGRTSIGAGTKIDNLVQIGHNARVGRRVLIAALSGLAGSTLVGDGAMLGGQVGVADHRRIGAGARVAAKSGVVGDVADGSDVAGYPALPHRRWLRAMARLAASGLRGGGRT